MLNQRGFIPILVLLVVALLAGYLIYQKQTTSSAPQPTEQPTPSDETVYNEALRSANWKTYKNSSYGFSLLYPPDWVVTEDKTNIKLEEKLSNTLVKKGVQITIYENAGSLNAMEFLDKIFYKDYKEQEKLLKDSYLKNASLQPIIIGNKPATKIKELQTPPGSYGTGIWVTDKTIGILLRSYPVADGEKVFDQLLSTFKFTDSNCYYEKIFCKKAPCEPILRCKAAQTYILMPIQDLAKKLGVKEEDITVVNVEEKEQNSKKIIPTIQT